MAGTIKHIAMDTGLGVATISSYLNGGNVREKNRIKIEAAIEKHDYKINEIARSLKTNKTKTIGVIIPELNNSFFAQIVTVVEDYLRQRGYALIICDCRTDAKREKTVVDFLINKRVDGIINMPVNTNSSHLTSFLQLGKPVILIDRKIDCENCDFILVDNEDASSVAVRKLLDSGHRKIGLVGGASSLYTTETRELGYRNALQNAGIQPEERLMCSGDYTIEGGRDAFTKLVKANPDMTAVVVVNNEMMVGAMIAANECNISIPSDLSFIGFDNIQFAKAYRPELTIVTQPIKEMALRTAELMLNRLNGTEKRGQQIIKLKAEILEGKSVRKIS